MNYILLLRTFIAAVKSVEVLMPASPGKAKFDAAIALVEEIVGDVTPMVPVLQGIATVAVNAFRSSGVFTTSTAK